MDAIDNLDRRFFVDSLRKDRDEEFMARKKNVTPGTTPGRSGSNWMRRNKDFDIYLGEALVPLLAQALEELSKVLQRQTDGGVPRVKERFHALRWIAQYILRQHPKYVRPPRKKKLYEKFSFWASLERGRREILRKKAEIRKIFDGFLFNRKLQSSHYNLLFESIDETFHLHGDLKDSPNLDLSDLRKQYPRDCDFDQFWSWFLRYFLRNDVISFTSLVKGAQEIENIAAEKVRQEKIQEQQRLDAIAKQEEEDSWFATLTTQREAVEANPIIQMLIKYPYLMLTGEHHKEDEVPCEGDHVDLLSAMMATLEFSTSTNPDLMGMYVWDGYRAETWEAWQEYCKFDLADGVVEMESLQMLLETAANKEKALKLRAVAEKICEARAEKRKYEEDSHVEKDGASEGDEQGKPSMAKLCEMFNFTMARLGWLHERFNQFLDEGVEDTYPVEPCAALFKDQIMVLMASIKPAMTYQEFEAKFKEIDTDGSGEIEFDEFVRWICTDELLSNDALELDDDEPLEKPSYAELAVRFDVTDERIMEVHDKYMSYIDGEIEDGYPDDPVEMSKETMYALLVDVHGEINEEAFEEQFEWMDFDGSGTLEFDEFLDFLGADMIQESGRRDDKPKLLKGSDEKEQS